MSSLLKLTIDGSELEVKTGTTVAAAIMMRRPGFRRSVRGELRGPVCGMGICFECRATVNGRTQQRTCQLLCEAGMVVNTDE
ncbi:MAG TPA: 2Fe-2S iron-sulfur cluster-binding protein [Terracidiphilus sp.]|nr:2Fe-2S iron-sulfur cluster-binding protein [Terracidiphilus sp.]